MSSRPLWVAALATVATLAWQPAAAQASAPVSRDQRKAETAAANKAGKLTPAGEGSAPATRSATSTGSTVNRAQRKSETAAANKAGRLAPAGSTQKADDAERARKTTASRSQRKAETAAANKAGKLTPAGEGSQAPSK
jgi:hypothetical protein